MQLALVVVIVVVSMAGREASSKDKDYDALWNQWKQDFGKDFASEEEEAKALKNFLDHDKEIDLRNGLYELGLIDWTAGHNSYSHLSHEDLKSRNGHINVDFNEDEVTERDLDGPRYFNYGTKYYIYRANSSVQIPDSSYRTIHSEPVQNQEGCGSCYAFAAGSVMVGYYEKFQSQNITVSRQEIVDCSRDCGNNGCDGGVEGWSLNYIVLNGISSTEQYPYKAVEQTCQPKLSTYKIDTNKYGIRRINGDPLSLKSALKTCGTISVAIYVDRGLNFYKSGVYTCCETGIVNHAVTLVGWGTTSEGNGYWIVKNSWGTSFGDKGYIKIAFGSCSIDSSTYSQSYGICPTSFQ